MTTVPYQQSWQAIDSNERCAPMQLGYRMSKAALNIAGVTIAGDLKKNQVRAH